jgi:hypothetical protein
MNLKQYRLKCLKNPIEFFLFHPRSNISVSLKQGDYSNWIFTSYYDKKFELDIEINEQIYSSLLNLNQNQINYINDCKNYYDLFEKWNIMDLINEKLI